MHNLTAFHTNVIDGTLNRLFWLPVPGNPIRNRYMRYALYPILDTKKLPVCHNSETTLITTRDWDEFGDTYVLPLDKIARSGTFGVNIEYGRDGIHFQCSFTNNGEGIMNFYQLRLRQFKTPRSGDCRDMPNLNVNMVILNMLSSNAGILYHHSK